MKILRAQLIVELRTLGRNPEQLLLLLVIPAALLLFFAQVDVIGDLTLAELVPGILGLATMSTAMVGLGIATGFERSSGVFKRLALTPLGTGRLVGAKALAVGVVLAAQYTVLCSIALALDWRPDRIHVPVTGAVILLAALAFTGIGLTSAGLLRAEANLAALNALYVVLLLISGFVIPSSALPDWLETTARALPAANLVDVLRQSLGADAHYGVSAWWVLGTWAVAAPLAAARSFRWS